MTTILTILAALGLYSAPQHPRDEKMAAQLAINKSDVVDLKIDNAIRTTLKP